MKQKYGEFSQIQMAKTKEELRKKIFFLLLCVDPKTKQEYSDINVEEAFDSLLYRVGGMNKILYEPPEIVTVISLLERAKTELSKQNFEFSIYRKLILDAGAEVLKIKEVE